MKTSKTHLVAKTKNFSWEESIVFQSKEWDEMYRGWGSNSQVCFVLEELMSVWGKEEWVEIFAKFNSALLSVNERLKKKFSWWVGVFTLYKKQWQSSLSINDQRIIDKLLGD